MFRFCALAAVGVVILGACVPSTESLVKQGKPIQKIYPAKSGVTAARMQNDLLNCKIEAAQRVPQNIQVETTPIYTTPVQTQCYNSGYGMVNCTQTGGQTYGGDTYSYDANDKLRSAAEAQCISRSGYRSATIPACPTTAKVKAPKAEFYKLSATTCYIGDKDGNYTISEY
jgi:hypothetical protein